MAAANGSPTAGTPEPTGGGAVLIARLAVMMFLQFFVWGSWYVSTGNFILNGSGWNDAAGVTGWAYSVAPIAAILAPLFLGMVADRFFASERVLAGLMLLGAVAMAAVPTVLGPNPSDDDTTLYLLLLFAHSLCFMPTLGLTNTVAFSHISNPEKQFPIVRVFGTLGWIVGSILVSKWETWFGAAGWTGPDLEAGVGQYWVTAVASAALAVYSLTLPHTPPPAKGQASTPADLLGFGAIGMMKDRSFAVFMIASGLLCIPLAGYYGFANGFLGDSGFEDPGFNMSFGQMSEVLFMLAMPFAFARLGVKWMLAAGMGAWVLRYALFSAAADGGPLDGDGAKGLILAGVILHGICYDFFFVTGQIYTEKRAPKNLRGQAQGFLVLMTQGVGLLIGAQLFGLLAGAYTTGEGDAAVRDWPTIWLWPCIAAAVILALFLLLFRDRLSDAQRAGLAASGEDTGAPPPATDPGVGGMPAKGQR
ncbi:MFS transporter [Alienimonas californiensis]|uniref:Nucleoside transporter YegT n=1 Tax=Alienimonas californiensis TaxID=2527989 RepID=A0A517PEX1_9PLAN|nr:MFS transporter [Alienimonas californiensis]QDT17918.1 Putative nucleoside transporter YegT [Alienimonas californiensis]